MFEGLLGDSERLSAQVIAKEIEAPVDRAAEEPGTPVRRMPELRLAGEPRWRRSFWLRGLEYLPVAF
jgi:hypothetical protein